MRMSVPLVVWIKYSIWGTARPMSTDPLFVDWLDVLDHDIGGVGFGCSATGRPPVMGDDAPARSQEP